MAKFSSNSDGFEMACVFRHETDNAVLIYDPVSDDEYWIPLSAVKEMHRLNDKGDGTIVMEMWIAKKRGFC